MWGKALTAAPEGQYLWSSDNWWQTPKNEPSRPWHRVVRGSWQIINYLWEVDLYWKSRVDTASAGIPSGLLLQLQPQAAVVEAFGLKLAQDCMPDNLRYVLRVQHFLHLMSWHEHVRGLHVQEFCACIRKGIRSGRASADHANLFVLFVISSEGLAGWGIIPWEAGSRSIPGRSGHSIPQINWNMSKISCVCPQIILLVTRQYQWANLLLRWSRRMRHENLGSGELGYASAFLRKKCQGSPRKISRDREGERRAEAQQHWKQPVSGAGLQTPIRGASCTAWCPNFWCPAEAACVNCRGQAGRSLSYPDLHRKQGVNCDLASSAEVLHWVLDFGKFSWEPLDPVYCSMHSISVLLPGWMR